jgi:dimethylargininase
MTRPIALLRGVPASFASALTSRSLTSPIDVELARSQHEAYRRALESGGFATRVLPPAEEHPDCPFVEDAAVILGRRALITRPGHPARRGETAEVARALRELVAVETMQSPAALDGGDVLQVGGRVFVGASRRTNRAGIDALRRFAAGTPVVSVPVRAGLHLKSAATAVGTDAVVVWSDAVDASFFEGLEVVAVGGDEPEAANTVRLADGRVLVAAAHARVAETLARRGLGVVTVDVSEFAKADGGLTCLSLRLRDVDAHEAS